MTGLPASTLFQYLQELTRVDEALEALLGLLLLVAGGGLVGGQLIALLGGHPPSPRRHAAVEGERAQRQLHRHGAQHADPDLDLLPVEAAPEVGDLALGKVVVGREEEGRQS